MFGAVRMPPMDHESRSKGLLLLALLGVASGSACVRTGMLLWDGDSDVTDEAGLFVAPWGDDKNPGTNGAPWRTVQHAASVLQPGETAWVRGGLYEERGIQFASSGSEGAPITIAGYKEEKAVIDGGQRAPADLVPVFDLSGREYLTLESLYIVGGSVANIYLGAGPAPPRHLRVSGCTIRDVVAGDGAGLIVIAAAARAEDIVIEGNHLEGCITTTRTCSGVLVLRAGALQILRNRIGGNLEFGIFYAHSNADDAPTLVQGNVITGANASGIGWSRRAATLQDNLLVGNYHGIDIFLEAGACDALPSDSNQILHNTIVGGRAGIILSRSACAGAVDTVVRDNVLVSQDIAELGLLAVWPYYGAPSYPYPDDSRTQFDHNLVYDEGDDAPIRVLGQRYAAGAAPLAGADNLQVAPSFVDEAHKDYRLLPGSSGYRDASDGLDRGADFEQCALP